MELDDTLIALADETRRSILKRLAAGEARVTEVAAPFDISLNSVSKHIRILERAGLVRRRIAGRDHFLSLEPGPLDAAAAWTSLKPRCARKTPSPKPNPIRNSNHGENHDRTIHPHQALHHPPRARA